MHGIKAVLFDFDGTIMDTNAVIMNSWQYTFEKIKGMREEESRILKTYGEPLTTSVEKLMPDVDTEFAVRTYREYQRMNFENEIEIFDGTVEILRELKRSDLKLAIVTSRLKKTTMEGVNKFGLNEYFDTIVTMEDTQKHKPEPEPILEALRRLEIRPCEAIMIGDSKFDIMCAYNADVKSVLVDWSVASKSGMDIDVKPDYRISRFDEIMEII